MIKIILNLFFIINIFLYSFKYSYTYSNKIKQDIEISNMKLHDVLTILSKESGKSFIASQNCKNLIIDTYFSRGEIISDIIFMLAQSHNLYLTKTNNITLFSLNSEKNSKRGKVVGKVIDYQNKPIINAKVEVKNLEIPPAFTNINGNFIIDDITKGVYILRISKKDHEDRGEIINLNKNIFSLNDIVLKQKKNLINSNINFKENNFQIDEEIHEDNFFEIDGNLLCTKMFELNFLSAEECKNILSSSFEENIKVNIVPKTNKILVIAEKDILTAVNKIIKNIDKNSKQVKITSQILDISNSLFEELGFDWVYKAGSNENYEVKNSLTANILNKTTATTGGNIFGSSLNIIRQFKNKNDILSLGISLLESNNDLVVSSMPSITIANEETGEFKVTEEVIVGEKREKKYSKNKKDKDGKYISEPIFKEAGLILKVKPTIKENNYIFLDISIELSDFKFKRNLLNISEINSGTFNSEGGSKVGRSLKTKVSVKNGDTILIGGLKKSIKQNLESKIPILGEIPLINFFFKNTSKKIENSDMYIKLKVDIEE